MGRSTLGRRVVARVAVLVLCGLGMSALCVVAGCKALKRTTVERVERLPYPDCGAGELPEGEVLASGVLRPDTGRGRDSVERFEIRRRACLVIATARIETDFELTDLEIVYDASGKPLRVWRRNTLAVTPQPDGAPDIALYELRGTIPTLIHRKPDGSVEYQTLAGGRPAAVISRARGLLTPWIQKSNLEVGESVHDVVIDLDTPDLIREGAMLRREPDLARAELGRTVRVYTVYGRDAVFTDDAGVVVGDLTGLVPADRVGAPVPRAQPLYGGPDPVHTP